MGAIKKYFNNQFKVRMLYLENDEVSEFYVSCLQNNRSALPLLCIRIIVFLACLGTVLYSGILTGMTIDSKYWPIYLTHWGLIFNTACALLACFVSLMAYSQGSIDSAFGLPWYVKAYWFSYNVAVPIAFFISAFYWVLLASGDEEFSINPVLDVFIHAVNSILMLVLLLTSSHSSHVLHFYQPLCVTIIYLIFNVIYYFAGGLNPMGEPWIYPDIDWRDPGRSMLMVVASAVLLLIVHFLVVLMTLGRDSCSRRYIRDTRKMSLQY